MALKLVIIGGGVAAVQVIQQVQKSLKDKVEIILISKLDHYYWNVASVRGVVDPTFAPKMFIPFDQLITKGRVVHTIATQVSEKQVVCQNGEQIDFDILVIATGMSYAAPFKTIKSTAKESLVAMNELSNVIRETTNILFVGAGATSLETIGEILHKYPHKKITVVSSGDSLVPGPYSPKLSHELKQELVKKGVVFHLGDKVANLNTYIPNPVEKGWNSGLYHIVTDKGVKIECGLIISAIGFSKPNTDFLKPLNILDDRGFVKVKGTLQVENHPNIFAIGDCCNFSKYKSVVQIGPQVGLLAKNIPALVNNKAMKSESASDPKAILVTLGPTGKF
eukprot:NODE_505_length_6682_cov_0.825394.p1 type:complete len:336 gc:universal NODE_505_length_6682_cov_0.825394:1167-160(-)